jgi:hypothetical protein
MPTSRSQSKLQKAPMKYSAVKHQKTMVKVLPHVMRSINELNIPAGNTDGFEILYFGVNLLLMFDYRLSFSIQVIGSDIRNQIEVFIISRKDVSTWKNTVPSSHHNNTSLTNITVHYRNNGRRIMDVFKPAVSDAYAFILSNRSSPNTSQKSRTLAVMVSLTHTWQQEVKESQLKIRV